MNFIWKNLFLLTSDDVSLSLKVDGQRCVAVEPNSVRRVVSVLQREHAPYSSNDDEKIRCCQGQYRSDNVQYRLDRLVFLVDRRLCKP